jgi:hypothetical protein
MLGGVLSWSCLGALRRHSLFHSCNLANASSRSQGQCLPFAKIGWALQDITLIMGKEAICGRG